MPVVNSPTSHGGELYSSTIIDDSNDTERQLCGAVDAMIADATRTLQQSAHESSAKVKLQGATTAFLRANGIRIAHENSEENTAGRVGSRDGGGGGNGPADANLRTQLEHCRDLLRKVDSERRHLRKQCQHLQLEQERRRAEVEAVHRYSAESHQRSLTLERNAAEERQRRRHLEEVADTQTQELMQLRRVLRALPSDLVASLNSPKAGAGAASASSSSAALAASTGETGQPLVPDRRFEEAFRDKMNSIVYKRRYRRAAGMHRAAQEQLEALLMEQHDPQNTLARWAFPAEVAVVDGAGGRTRASVDETAAAAAGENAALAFAGDAEDRDGGAYSSKAAALASAVFWQSALDFPFQLPFSTATPHDAVIKSLVYRSRYAEPLTQLREHALRLTSRLKTAQDSGLRALYTSFVQALQRSGGGAQQAQCKALYERQMDKMQRAHRELLYGLIEQVNKAATDIPEMERGRGISSSGSATTAATAIGSQAAQRRDVGCSAREPVSVEEYRTSQLKEQLSRLKLQSLEAASAALREKEAVAVQCATARQEALQALQSLKKLTTGVITSLHAQNSAGDVIYDPLSHVAEPLDEGVLDDPRLVTKMVEATDLTLVYVRQLARGNAAAAKGCVSPPHTVSHAEEEETAPAAARQKGGYGCIINIHHRNDGFAGASAAAVSSGRRTSLTDTRRAHKADRRASAPASLNATVRSSRSNSAAAAREANVVRRRLNVPQLPAMAATTRTPTAPTTKRGARGRPEPTEQRAVGTTPPPLFQEQREPLSVARAPTEAVKVAMAANTPSKTNSPAHNAAISVIELGFSDNNIRLD